LHQLRSHPLGLSFAAHNEASIPWCLRAKMREAQEIKRLMFTFAFLLSIRLRLAHDDHVAFSLRFPPLINSQIKDVVQVDVA
jgi:hypothetical protein